MPAQRSSAKPPQTYRRPRDPRARAGRDSRDPRRVRAAIRGADDAHARHQGLLRSGRHSQSGPHVCGNLRWRARLLHAKADSSGGARTAARRRPRPRPHRAHRRHPSGHGPHADLHLRHHRAVARDREGFRQFAAPDRLVHALPRHPRLPVLCGNLAHRAADAEGRCRSASRFLLALGARGRLGDRREHEHRSSTATARPTSRSIITATASSIRCPTSSP